MQYFLFFRLFMISLLLPVVTIQSNEPENKYYAQECHLTPLGTLHYVTEQRIVTLSADQWQKYKKEEEQAYEQRLRRNLYKIEGSLTLGALLTSGWTGVKVSHIMSRVFYNNHDFGFRMTPFARASSVACLTSIACLLAVYPYSQATALQTMLPRSNRLMLPSGPNSRSFTQYTASINQSDAQPQEKCEEEHDDLWPILHRYEID